MEKPISYLDWEDQFKKRKNSHTRKVSKKRKRNSIGISESFFKNYLEKWKKKNLKH